MNLTSIAVGLVLVGSLTCSGCATPPGRMTQNDFSWTEATVNTNYQDVYRRIVTGFRSCSNVDVPEGNIYTDLQEAMFDVYNKGIGGSRTDFVAGMIKLTAADDGTKVSIGANNSAFEWLQEKRKKQWLNFAQGDFTCL
jgi:hypothetical protein